MLLTRFFASLFLLFRFCTCIGVSKCRVKYDLSRCYSVNETVALKNRAADEWTECHDADSGHICDKHFNITYIETEPYNVHILMHVLGMENKLSLEHFSKINFKGD